MPPSGQARGRASPGHALALLVSAGEVIGLDAMAAMPESGSGKRSFGDRESFEHDRAVVFNRDRENAY
jgi:hypothetical protein